MRPATCALDNGCALPFPGLLVIGEAEAEADATDADAWWAGRRFAEWARFRACCCTCLGMKPRAGRTFPDWDQDGNQIARWSISLYSIWKLQLAGGKGLWEDDDERDRDGDTRRRRGILHVGGSVGHRATAGWKKHFDFATNWKRTRLPTYPLTTFVTSQFPLKPDLKC